MLHILYGNKYGNCTGPIYIKLTKAIISVRVQGQWWKMETEGGMVIKYEFIYNTYMPFKKTECAYILFAPFCKKCAHK